MKHLIVGLIASTIVCTTLAAQSQYKVLYSFGANGSNDGIQPNAGLAYYGGQIFGTTQGGGQTDKNSPCYQYFGGCGVVFAAESFYGNGAEAVIYSFCNTGNPSTCSDGALPSAGLISDRDGNLYGTTQGGGTGLCYDSLWGNCGTVFELTRVGNTWSEIVLHNFNGIDGERPTGPVAFDSAGNLYGTTVYGGVYGAGTVFELSPGPDGVWTDATLHDFNPSNTDGVEPYHSGLTIDSLGNVYGTTPGGGGANCKFDDYIGCGTVFELSPNPDGTWTETILYRFGKKEPYPEASVILDQSGHVYGTTFAGGCGSFCGSLFRLSAVQGGWKENRILLNSQNGGEPLAPLLLSGRVLYGAASVAGANGYGVIFEVKDGAYTILHNFSGAPNDGAYPVYGGPLLLKQGSFYGTTQNGGVLNLGTIFELTP